MTQGKLFDEALYPSHGLRDVPPATTPAAIVGALLDGTSDSGLALNAGITPEDAAAAVEATRKALAEDTVKRRRRKPAKEGE